MASDALIKILIAQGIQTILTGKQTMIAREMLGWTREQLALRARVRTNTVIAFETDNIYPLPQAVKAIRSALEQANIRFSASGELVCKNLP